MFTLEDFLRLTREAFANSTITEVGRTGETGLPTSPPTPGEPTTSTTPIVVIMKPPRADAGRGRRGSTRDKSAQKPRIFLGSLLNFLSRDKGDNTR